MNDSLEHDNLTLILGPPGTGKTTRLLDCAAQLLAAGAQPEKLAFVTFTKRAAQEAVERAQKQFRLKYSDLPWFRTIHSVAFHQLGISYKNMIRPSNIKEMAQLFGVELETDADEQSEEPINASQSRGNKLLFLDNLARTSYRTLEDVWSEQDHGIGHDPHNGVHLNELQMFSMHYESFKHSRGLLDYTDLLLQCIERNMVPRVNHIIVDEAQDLSKAQWDMIRLMAKHAETVTIAGDDDQAIYRWAGADTDAFTSLKATTVTVLDQSYRIPDAVHSFATSITDRLGSSRLQKVFKPKAVLGVFQRIHSISCLDMSAGNWLLLARHQIQFSLYQTHCLYHSWNFSVSGRPFVKTKDAQAIAAWKELQAGKEVPAHLVLAACERMSRITPEGLLAIRQLAGMTPLTLLALTNDFGLAASGNELWHTVLDKVPVKQSIRYRSLERSGELLLPPRIAISTIHGAKGSQADNVVLRVDIGERVDNAMINYGREHDELRVFYVGATRAKHALYLLEPQSARYMKL